MKDFLEKGITALWQYIVNHEEVVMAAVFALILNALKDTVLKDTWNWVKKRTCQLCRFVKRTVIEMKNTVRWSFRAIGVAFDHVECIEDFMFAFMWLMMLISPMIWAVIHIIQAIGSLINHTPVPLDSLIEMLSIEIVFVVLTLCFFRQSRNRREREGWPDLL